MLFFRHIVCGNPVLSAFERSETLCCTLYDGLCMETQTNAPVQSKKEDR